VLHVSIVVDIRIKCCVRLLHLVPILSYICDKRKESEAIFMHLCTTVDHEPDVYKVSIITLFTIVREFRLQQRRR